MEGPSGHVCREDVRLQRAGYVPDSVLTEGAVAAVRSSRAVASSGCVATGHKGRGDTSDSVLKSRAGAEAGRTLGTRAVCLGSRGAEWL